MKEMILCMLVLAIIIGAANLLELPARVDLRAERQGRAANYSRVHAALTP